ncbi:acetyl-CoA acetyltransferase, putative [Ixodes scapularis]|uniref:Acetyl-CoA acetyltransferase, putative n=1 Tax=Ixodes scapularis TaxID=6945 RepID=B7PDP6_IXOSC|nr:acetyl-CoA acetyltransferase, putative [Ixodes scapularis]|eukprot:XP_002410990.1 acetyl-CoA acetyltransferase, putative [Ixodes scapularis]
MPATSVFVMRLAGIYIVGAKRTPFGAMGGKLKDFTPTQLAVIASKAALDSAGVKPENVDVCIAGIINQVAAKDSPYCSRNTALQCVLPQHTPCLNVNPDVRIWNALPFCILQEILLGNAEIALTVGTENMSMSPFIVRDARFGIKFGMQPEVGFSPISPCPWLQRCLHLALSRCGSLYPLKSSTKSKLRVSVLRPNRRVCAQEAGRFKEEMVPIPVKVKGKEVMFDTDEHPRPGTTMETLAKLPALFKKDGTVTAGNASGICDGAGAILIAGEEAVKKHNLKPLARIVGYSYVGVDPTIMGIGPAPAIRKLCDKTGVKVQDLDLVDVNEAFASQFLAVERDLQLDPAKSNVNGGAIALGHPVGASGARILANLTYELRDRKGKYAVGSACIGGGQGIAVMLESV